MTTFLIQLIAFASVFLFVIGIQSLIRSRQYVGFDEKTLKPGLFNTFQHEIDAVGTWIETPLNSAFPEQTNRIRNDLIVAAVADRLSVRDIRGMQGFAGGMLFFLGAIIVFMINMSLPASLLTGLALGLIGWIIPVTWISRMALQRQDQISRALPYAIDLLTVAMQAGQDFGAAVRFLVNEGPVGPLRQEFAITLKQTELGKSRVEALKDMVGRIQLDEFKSLVAAVVQSTEMGSSLADTLKLQAEEIRRRRFHRAERKAARAPSIMLIPIALFILPAVFIVIFTPVFLRIKGVLGAGEGP